MKGENLLTKKFCSKPKNHKCTLTAVNQKGLCLRANKVPKNVDDYG